jgi:two-component system alkaline phosphatase synthesis response regulator PhoP
MSKINILCIEDDYYIRMCLEFMLNSAKYGYLGTETGLEGIKMAIEKKPDLILLDMRLPDFNGLQVCKKLKSEPVTESIPIIMLSALAEDADIVLCLEAGAEKWIQKPFEVSKLLDELTNTLEDTQQKTNNQQETRCVTIE